MGVPLMGLVLWQVSAVGWSCDPVGDGDIRAHSTTRESLCAIYIERREVCDRGGEMCADW